MSRTRSGRTGGHGQIDGQIDRQSADELVDAGLSRAGFLRLAGAAAVGVAAAPLLPAGTASAAALSPLDLHLSLVGSTRPFDLVAPRFVDVDLLFSGSAAAAPTAPSEPSDGGAVRAQRAGGALSLTSAAAAGAVFRLGATPIAPFATVIVDVAATPAPGTSVLVGLVGSGSDRVVARFTGGRTATTGTVSIVVSRAGATTTVVSAAADLTGPARFAFSVQENYVTALVGRTASWVPVAQARLLGDDRFPQTGLDLRDPDVLRTHAYGYGVAGSGAQVALTRIQAGLYGQVGVRDPHVVSRPDGTPYVRDGKLYFTLTNAGLSFFQAAHWGVWRLDLAEPTRIEHVAQLFFRRDGLVLGDHAGQIVVDEERGLTHLAMSGWGDFAFEGVHVRYLRTREDVLRGAHVLDSRRMALPTQVSSWDPGLTRIDGRWHLSFVESPFQSPTFDFHPALARGPVGSEPDTGLQLVGADRSRHMTEGPVLTRIGGRWWLLASDGELRRYPVYDLAMRFQGYLQAPYGTNIPHPMIVPQRSAGRTSYLMLSFNGTQYREEVLGYGTHGDFLVLRARETEG